MNCAAPLARRPGEGREVRKVVTLVFTDVTGSTPMAERLDPETFRRVMARYFESMKPVIERHGGVVEKFVGDAVLAVFGIPVLHEDDALRAVRAAEEMRLTLGDLNKELERDRGVSLQVRIGVNSGEVVAGDLSIGEEFVTGDAVNVAARLEQAAPPGDILLGRSTYRLVKNAVEVEPLDPLELKGKSEPVSAYRLLTVSKDAPAFARHPDAPLVGRAHELELLQRALERTAHESSCHLFTILGAAGVGKSRLVSEFIDERRSSSRVVQGRCLPYGEGITLWPLAEVIKDAAGLSESSSRTEVESQLRKILSEMSDGARVSGLLLQILGVDKTVASTEELAWASRRLLEKLASDSSLIVLVDDIHWAEPALLDIIEYIATWSRDSPFLFLCVARPEFLDARPNWAAGKLNATSLLLEPLSAEESGQLVEGLLGEAGLPGDVSQLVFESAEGNPLFVEQLLEMLIDDGLLTETADGWVLAAPIEQLTVPPTINALISARLDRLGHRERLAIERASVVGKEFSLSAVSHLAPGEEKQRVADDLTALTRKEMIRPLDQDPGGELTFGFRHILIRDAAYDSISKERRADLHLDFADWMQTTVPVDGVGFAEILAHHLSLAHRNKRDLGSPPEVLHPIASQAARQYEISGERALARSDFPAAAKLLRNGAALVVDPMESSFLLLLLAEVLYLQGCSEEALEYLDQISDSTDELMNTRTEIVRTLILASMGDRSAVRRGQELGRASVPLFEAADDLRWVARAWTLATYSYNVLGETAEQIDAAERAVAAAVAADDRHVELQARTWLGAAHAHGFTPVDEVLTFIESQRASTPDALGFQGFLFVIQGLMRSLIGQFEEARDDVGRAIELTEELGLSFLADLRRGTLAWVEMVAGDYEECCRQLRDLRERLERHGDKLYLSTFLAQEADCLCELGRYEDAETAALYSREITAPDDVASAAGWRGALARVLVARGDIEASNRLLAEGAEILLPTETFYRADFSVQAAKVHLVAGDVEEARRCFAAARKDFARKGATACVASVDSWAAPLG
jgi:predicted ATPase/class 3 adenylate cyclase